MATQFSIKALATCKSFNLQHAFRPIPQVNYKISDNLYHPLREKVLKRLETQNKPQLIITITASIKKTSPKAVVRKKSVHRIREATYQVLEEKGYGKDGKAKNGGSDLVGTLAFRTTTETVLTPWEELKKEVREALGKWIVLRQKNSYPAKNVARTDARPGLYSRRREQGGAEGATGARGYERGVRRTVGVGAGGYEKRAGEIENWRGRGQGGQKGESWDETRNSYSPGSKSNQGRGKGGGKKIGGLG